MRLLFVLLMGLSLLGQAPQKFSLPNGLEVLLVEQHDRPLLRIKLRVGWRDKEAPPPADLALMTRLLAQPGSGNPTGELEDARADLRFEAGHRAFSWTVVAPSSEQEAALGLMAQQVFRATFEPVRVEQLRRTLRSEFREASPELLAQDRFLGLLGFPTPLFGEAESALDRQNYESLLRLRKALVRPERSRLVLQGDLSLEQARQLALLHFGTWHGDAPTEVPASPVAPSLVVSAQAARGLEVWVAIPGKPADGILLQGVTRALAHTWRRAPAPFETISILEGGAEGIVLLRFVAPMRAGSLPTLKAVLGMLEGLSSVGIPASSWLEARRETDALARVEALHPGIWTRRLALEGLSDRALPRDPAELNAELARLLAPDRLRFLLLGAEPDARPSLEGAGFKPLIWVNR